eukprot:TRINITY_DN33978_c0_g1_i1.p1 TRINITY_DN33978_c0_g1~~TRINITY_DN33978_c0_g1_i1.p1  ORF type:complete len:538 (-),score=48.65 TRINITY_DN33978_c0_g1_i1:148-1707(-)
MAAYLCKTSSLTRRPIVPSLRATFYISTSPPARLTNQELGASFGKSCALLATAFTCRPGALRFQSSARIALFIDGDQVGYRAFGPILKALEPEGDVVVRRLYAPDHDAKRWEKVLAKLDITQVSLPRRRGGAKDVVDIAIALDVAEVLASDLNSGDSGLQSKGISAVALASSDFDYLHILRRVKSWGVKAYYIVDKKPTVAAIEGLRASAFECGVNFVNYELDGETRSCRVGFVMTSGTSHMIDLSEPPPALEQPELTRLIDTLQQLQYLSSQTAAELKDQDRCRLPPLDALAKFLHNNSTLPFIVFPHVLCAKEAISLISRKQATEGLEVLVPYQHDLIFVVPHGDTSGTRKLDLYGGTRAAKTVSGGGPFLIQDTAGAVQSILQRMRYLDTPVDQHDPVLTKALQLFCQRNSSNIKIGSDVGVQRTSELENTILSVLRERYNVQWKCCLSDEFARTHLQKVGMLPKKGKASQENVLKAVRKFLARKGEACNFGNYYWGGIAQYTYVVHVSADPNSRK